MFTEGRKHVIRRVYIMSNVFDDNFEKFNLIAFYDKNYNDDTHPARVHVLRLKTQVIVMDDVRDILLAYHHKLDGLAGLLNDLDGLINVPRSLVVDGDDPEFWLHQDRIEPIPDYHIQLLSFQ